MTCRQISIAISLTLSLATLTAPAAESTPTPSSQSSGPTITQSTAQEKAAATETTTPDGPPLNKYGAVDVNANVPVEVQVPTVPADFIAPTVTPLNTLWQDSIPTPPTFPVNAYLLMSAQTGDILAASNPNLRVAPASITKLMLLYVIMQQLKAGTIHLTDMVHIPEVAWATGGSRMFLKPGTQVSVSDLIRGTIVDSGNDAAVALAIYVAGSQSSMVNLMNRQAQKLGMTNTHFNDVMGLPAPKHYSSAHDLAIMGRAIVMEFPQHIPWFAEKYFTYNNIRQSNFNRLLFIDSNADGLKTGSTSAAGFSLVGTAKLPNQPMRLISIMLGAPSNQQTAEFSKSLLTYGFRFFKDETYYTAKQKLQSVKVYKGESSTIDVGPMQTVTLTLPNNNHLKLAAKLTLQKTLVAPIAKGQTVGELQLSTTNGKTVKTVPVVALEADPRGNWWARMIDSIKLWF